MLSWSTHLGKRQCVSILRDLYLVLQFFLDQPRLQGRAGEAAMIERLHVHGNDFFSWNAASDLAHIVRIHGNRAAGCDKGRSTGIEDDNLWRKLLQGLLDLRAPDRIPGDVKGWLVIGVQHEAGGRGHPFPELTFSMLSPGTI